MKKIISTTVFAIILLLIACDKQVAQKPAAQEELNYESLVQEKDSPLLFMDVEAKIRNENDEVGKQSNFMSGTISNTAMQTKFKDVLLLVKYYSATNDLIESAEFVVYKFFEPNTRTKFELNIHPPASMHTFDVEVKNAKATN
ncbi:MAG: hypothetical protein H0U95_03390 [Bacteroidetes bacterium]|nr:hypothetical protein [Bacteroidota bacterium]